MFNYLRNKWALSKMIAETAGKMASKKMFKDEKAETPVGKIVGLLVIAILTGALIPTALTSLKAANTTTWEDSEVAAYGVIAIMIIIAVVVMVAKLATE